MGAWDKITGGQPKSWSDAQFATFKVAYNSMVEGKFSWTDAIPPLNLPGAGGKIAMLSTKGMLSLGERGVYALKVERLHEELKTQSLASIRSHWINFGPASQGFLDKNAERVFVRLCVMHVEVYGKLK